MQKQDDDFCPPDESGNRTNTRAFPTLRLPPLNVGFKSLLESVTILTISGAYIFVCGAIYTAIFYSRLSIPWSSLSLSRDVYIWNAVGPAMVLLIVAITCFLLFQIIPLSITRFLSVTGPLLISVLAFGYSFWTNSGFEEEASVLWNVVSMIAAVLVGVALIGLYVAGEWRKPASYNSLAAVSAISLLLILMPITAVVLGRGRAERLLEGRSDHAMFVKDLTLAYEIPAIRNKHLVLVTKSEGNYFMLEPVDPVPSSPTIYVIPVEAIRSMVLEHWPYDGPWPESTPIATPVEGN